jgi:alkanesulfonate monooxygenase
VYTDNSLIDPWAAAQLMIEHTDTLVPMVAVQPIYMHPYTVARMISTIGYLYGREVDVNLVTGGFAGSLHALGCELDHDERYERLVEYGLVVKELLCEDRQINHDGKHYQLASASLIPGVQPGLLPRFFVSGSSSACIAARNALGAVRLAYPRSPEDYGDELSLLRGTGIRVGVIARHTAGEAWQIARKRFPEDSSGERMHDYAARTLESHWHLRLSADVGRSVEPVGGYWLYPFRAFKTFCPYLVGSHQEVGELLARYLELGITTVILDVPETEDDLSHAQLAFRIAEGIVGLNRLDEHPRSVGL